MPVEIPCGQCIGCRLERSRQWAIRCVHEAQLHQENCFITLTYDDDNLPLNRSLDISHFQKFMKRLRKFLPQKVRFYHCGEYGDTNGRPHYHACIFGHDFPDKIKWTEREGIILYRSRELETLWPAGFSTIGDVTFESAAYCARYILKKVNGELAKNHYVQIDPFTGEITYRQPEYTTMSRRPGIGTGWFSRFNAEVYPADEVIMRGRPIQPPKFYDGLYELGHPIELEKIKQRRKRKASKFSADQTPERLKVRCQVQKSQIKQLPRKV